jgi:hypothetical protein
MSDNSPKREEILKRMIANMRKKVKPEKTIKENVTVKESVTDTRGVSDTPHVPVTCLHCERLLSESRSLNYKKYCSDACYERARRLRHRFKNLLCQTCDTEFVSARVDASYCSNACRQAAYRRRPGAAA